MKFARRESSIIFKLLHGWREVEKAKREEGIKALGRFGYHAKASFIKHPLKPLRPP